MDENDRQEAQGVVGATAGGAGGALLGTLMGGVLGGPVGMVVGAGIGTLAGAAAGYSVDYGTFERDIREEHEADSARVRHPWEEANPAYRYGWEARERPEFRDKVYEHVQPELHKGWTGSGDFADYEGYVRRGWDRRAAVTQDGGEAQPAKE